MVSTDTRKVRGSRSTLTLFAQLGQARAGLKRIRGDVKRFRDALSVGETAGANANSAADLHLQLTQALWLFDELRDGLTPIVGFHADQPGKTEAKAASVLPSPVDMMADTLKDASRWLQTAGDTFGLQCLKDAAARARAALKAVS